MVGVSREARIPMIVMTMSSSIIEKPWSRLNGFIDFKTDEVWMSNGFIVHDLLPDDHRPPHCHHSRLRRLCRLGRT